MFPYLELLHLLNPTLSVEEYRSSRAKLSRYATQREVDQSPHMQKMPEYGYAVCPICNTPCSAQIDTYALPSNTLKFTLQQHSLPRRGYPQGFDTPCQHYLGVQSFINLHDNIPREVFELNLSNGEVPFVTPWLLLDDYSGFAVLHSLPICRIVFEEFVPTYIRYFLTYFCQSPYELLEHTYSLQAEDAQNESDYQPYITADSYRIFSQRRGLPKGDGWQDMQPQVRIYYEEKYDLDRWAKAGKLGYIDFAAPDLPLRIGKGLTLPEIYRSIPGRKYYFYWRDGEFRTT